jgi:hypothetical protein
MSARQSLGTPKKEINFLKNLRKKRKIKTFCCTEVGYTGLRKAKDKSLDGGRTKYKASRRPNTGAHIFVDICCAHRPRDIF